MAKLKFDDGWRFYNGDLPPYKDTDGWGGAKAKGFFFGAAAFDFDDSKWRNVDLPHDFVMEGDYTQKHAPGGEMRKIPEMESIDSRHFAGGSLEGGTAWYRKTFTVPADTEEGRVYVHFDGVYRNSTVYLNEYLIGTHKSGYTGVCYDITDFVNFGEKNVIAVRVDASGREGWWYEGGGIYRHVWLEYKSNIHIVSDGVYVHYEVSEDMQSAVIYTETELVSKSLADAGVTVYTSILSADGNVLKSAQNEAAINAWDNALCRTAIKLDGVHLWDIDDPYLYTVKTQIIKDGQVIDEENTVTGIRCCCFDADSGFYLNGRSVKIKGLCCHHDHAGVGIGVPDGVWEYRMAQLKSMGANGYRCAHYPPSREMLEICDRIGLLVMDETRRMSSAPEDIEALRYMVKQGRNHPSVFIWCIGNEEIFSQDRPETVRITVTMKMEVRRLDKMRPITAAVVCWNGKERFENAEKYVDITKNLDVMGFNYCKQAWDDYHKRMPYQPMIITEAASNSGTRGCYSTDESTGQYYILDPDNKKKCKSGIKAVKKDVGESEWEYFAQRPYLSGIFLWTGIDYRGEPTPMAYPAVYSQFGIMDYCALPKDNYYYYKSWWSDEDVLHIFPHWNHPDDEGKIISVHCYSNFDEVELLVNGKSYGKKAMEKNRYLTWDNVIYESGEVRAIGYRNGVRVRECAVKTTREVKELKIIPYKDTISKKDDAVVINICAVDENGNVVPTADNRVHFSVTGGGVLLGTGNGNPSSHESEKAPVRRLFNGWVQLLVKPDSSGKDITVTVRTDNLKSRSKTVMCIG